MATGRSTQLAKQVGEYLVAAELCRHDLIATTFAGSLPDYDIVAVDAKGKHLAIQVKAIRGGDWQLNATRFINITLDEARRRQILGRNAHEPYPNLVCIFVILDTAYGNDRFFILRWRQLQRLVANRYRSLILSVKGRRPKNWKSTHTIVREKQLLRFENKWEIIQRMLESRA
jgi:hypothetical protein